MFENFLIKYSLEQARDSGASASDSTVPIEIIETLNQIGSGSFKSGLYHTYSVSEINEVTKRMFSLYPKAKDRLAIFGYSWLGNQFALDLNSKTVSLLQVSTAKVFDIPVSICEFHNDVLIDKCDAALDATVFEAWKVSSRIEKVPFGKCVGYKTPPSLGGELDVENLELSDLEIYLSLLSQLL